MTPALGSVGLPVAEVDTVTSTTHWTMTDHLGTPILWTDSTPAVAWRVEHEPYGRVFKLRIPGTDLHQPLPLPGQEAEQIPNTGINGATEKSYNVFRWYRPNWGRYTQADPLSGVLPTWQDPRRSSVLFGYGASNPLYFVDRTGLTSGSAVGCCSCPEREWSYTGVSNGIGFVIGWTNFHGTYTCRSNRTLSLKVDGTCKSFGLQAYATVIEVNTSATPAGVVGGKGCNSADLLGHSSSLAISGEVVLDVGGTAEFERSTGSIDVGVGIGARFAGQDCLTKPYRPLIATPGQAAR